MLSGSSFEFEPRGQGDALSPQRIQDSSHHNVRGQRGAHSGHRMDVSSLFEAENECWSCPPGLRFIIAVSGLAVKEHHALRNRRMGVVS